MTDMAARENSMQDVVRLADVKALAGAVGPCITLVISIPNPAELADRLKSALRSIQKQLVERHTNTETAAGLKDVAVVGERFEIRPLLAALSREQRFHLLAFGRHHVRLFRTTARSTEEVRLEGVAPRNMQEFLHTSQPDHLLEKRMSAGPSVGSMQGVLFGTGSESEKEQDRVRHFLKEVERGVTKIMQRDAEPLILAGVEYDVAIYRQLNTYPHLLEQAIHGSPERLTAQNLHERAWEIVSQCPSEPLRKALANYREQSGAALLLGDTGAIVKAAAEGRVAGLFLSESAGAAGQPDDPLNVAALETVLHGGWAFALNPAEMPAKDSAAALLRF
jgi:hypothetical protein